MMITSPNKFVSRRVLKLRDLYCNGAACRAECVYAERKVGGERLIPGGACRAPPPPPPPFPHALATPPSPARHCALA